MYWVHKRLLSQNFLHDRKLVKELIRNSSIGHADSVLEIGPGQGIITRELIKVSRQVIAIEKDEQLYNNLKQNLGNDRKLRLVQDDFLNFPLPKTPYKVLSNIPFSQTGNIVRKLLHSANPPAACYLIMQSEAAAKFIVHEDQNTMAAIHYFPWWDIKVIHNFNRSNFTPKPKVDCVLLSIIIRPQPLLSQKNLYEDFVTFHYTRDKSAKYVPVAKWLQLFNSFLSRNSSHELNLIRGSFIKLQREQLKLSKIHRTRVDKNWKKY